MAFWAIGCTSARVRQPGPLDAVLHLVPPRAVVAPGRALRIGLARVPRRGRHEGPRLVADPDGVAALQPAPAQVVHEWGKRR
eukprot:13853539-Alexandrium_andersonii.AAC.1